MDADAVELRVLGCLIEKQRTTHSVEARVSRLEAEVRSLREALDGR